MTVQRAGELLNLPTSRIYDLARRQELASVRIGKYIRFRRAALDEFIARHEQAGVVRRPRP